MRKCKIQQIHETHPMKQGLLVILVRHLEKFRVLKERYSQTIPVYHLLELG